MLSNRIRIKILTLLILTISTWGLTRANAQAGCGPEECVRITENRRPVGHGCISGGTVNRRCTATMSGCFFESCSLFD